MSFHDNSAIKSVRRKVRVDGTVQSVMPDGDGLVPEQSSGHQPPVEEPRAVRRRGRPRAATRRASVSRLTASDEIALAARIKSGDTAARERLVIANLALVLRAVKAYRRSGIPVDDLVQEGNLALVRAAQTFDPSTHTARFATYAGIWIRSSLGRALGTNGPLIHVPERPHRLRVRYRRAIDALRQQAVTESRGVSPKSPSLEEIASYMGVTMGQLKNAGATRSDLVVDRILGEAPVADGPPPDVQVVNEEARARLYSALRKLPRFEAWVIRERYGLPEFSAEQRVGGRSRPRRIDKRRKAPFTLRRYGRGPKHAPPLTQLPARSLRGAWPDGARLPSQCYHHRSFIELVKDCGLSITRIRQAERDALEELRRLLTPRLGEAM